MKGGCAVHQAIDLIVLKNIYLIFLIDNAYDPDVNASQLFIDVGLSNGQHSLVFTDNGSGMLPDQLYKMVR